MSDLQDIYDIYEERLDDDNTLDLSSKCLESVPDLMNLSIVVLYLQNNKLTILPDDFFPSLPFLVYLDLRDNCLRELPTTIKNHQSLTHLLVQNNCLTALPNELGTLSLKILQVSGNPLMYPPEEILNAGQSKILSFLHDKYEEKVLEESQDLDSITTATTDDPKMVSLETYNSVIDEAKIKGNLKVEVSEKHDRDDSDEEFYAKIKGKCPKLDRSRHKVLPFYCQSSKYLKPLYVEDKMSREERIKRNYFKDMAIQKRKELLATREKILQERKNLENLKNWRNKYRTSQFFSRDGSYRLDPKHFPFDTSPEYLKLLTREDIEKDLPDKYRKSLVRQSKPVRPRKPKNDVHLAMKIKKLFENLDSLALNKETMTPRTEQKVLLNEIQKITEIKQKLKELSFANMTSVSEL
ncbi:leucine rich repeat domain-containing protein [Phthorimaea operculella]|nr:leucine rich repeat domain-containing protein [Phthorimaea operculella]